MSIAFYYKIDEYRQRSVYTKEKKCALLRYWKSLNIIDTIGLCPVSC